MRLDNWSVASGLLNPYSAPETAIARLYGKVTGHENFFDGERVTTSQLLALDVVGRKARTKNNIYSLGGPDVDWLRWVYKSKYSLTQFSFGKIEK